MNLDPSQGQLFELPWGAWCEGCILAAACQSMQNVNVCPPVFDPLASAGINALHPARVDFEDHFRRAGGIHFDDVVARPWHRIELPSYLPQVRWRSGLRTERVSRSLLGVRLHEVFSEGRVRSAAELRSHLELTEPTRLILIPFSPDATLEELARDWPQHLAEIAAGGWDLVLPPSFSLWGPQRRPDNLLSLRRSHVTYGALQDLDVNTIPRVGWVEPIDMERFAAWVNENPAVELVTLDLQTYPSASFDRSVALLARFDRLTRERLHYLVNGVKSYRRIGALYLATAPERMTVTEATTARVPAVLTSAGRTLAARSLEVEERCVTLKELLRRVDQGSDLEQILAEIRDLPVIHSAQAAA